MDFSKAKVVKQANSATVEEKTESILLEGQRKVIKERAGYDSYAKVYQGCDTCKRVIGHYIIGDVVTCLGCGNNYKLVSKDKCNLN